MGGKPPHQQAEADLAEAETEQLGDLVNSEFVFEAEASRVSEWGTGHQRPAEEGHYSSVWWPPLKTVTASSPSLPRAGQFRSWRRLPWSPRLLRCTQPDEDLDRQAVSFILLSCLVSFLLKST